MTLSGIPETVRLLKATSGFARRNAAFKPPLLKGQMALTRVFRDVFVSQESEPNTRHTVIRRRTASFAASVAAKNTSIVYNIAPFVIRSTNVQIGMDGFAGAASRERTLLKIVTKSLKAVHFRQDRDSGAAWCLGEFALADGGLQ